MGSFFAKIGKGLLYLLVLPLFLVIISIVAVIGIIAFIILFFKQLFLFFAGKSLYGDLPEDIQLKALIESQNQPKPNYQNPMPQPQQPYQAPPINPQPQQAAPIIHVNISPEALVNNSQPFIVEPEPQRMNNLEPIIMPEPRINEEQRIIISSNENNPQPFQQPVFPKDETQNDNKMGYYQSGDPVFSNIKDDDNL